MLDKCVDWILYSNHEYTILLILFAIASFGVCNELRISYDMDLYIDVLISVSVSVVFTQIHFSLNYLPSDVCTLIKNFGHKKCVLCQCSWEIEDDEWDVLVCGHSFHRFCLKRWEFEQKKQGHFYRYKCVICRRLYTFWSERWHVETQHINELHRKGIWIVDAR
eukprot:333250_1